MKSWLEKLYEQDQVFSEAHAKELLQAQTDYNNKLQALNNELAKRKSDLAVKYMKISQQQSAEAQAKAAVQPAAKTEVTTRQGGTVDTAGNPVTAGGAPVTTESINILKFKKIEEDIDFKALADTQKKKYGGHDMRNWYQKPNPSSIEEKPKKVRSKRTKRESERYRELEYEIQDLEDSIKYEMEPFQTPTYTGIQGEIEDFFGEIGPAAAEILNSGYGSDEEKLKALKITGVADPKGTLETYYYYYPEFNKALDKKRKEAEKNVKKMQVELDKLKKEYNRLDSIYESINESTYSLINADTGEIQSLKDYMDQENISYSEDEDGTTITFDEDELDDEWRDQLPEIGLEVETDDILSMEDDEFDDDSDIISKDKQIDAEKVFYVKIDDEGEAFIGKIYKLFDDGDWRSKIVDGQSETFEKLNYDPEWDEFDIIAFLRENYADAELVDEEEFNDHVEDPELEPEITEKLHIIPTLDEFLNEEAEDLDIEGTYAHDYPHKEFAMDFQNKFYKDRWNIHKAENNPDKKETLEKIINGNNNLWRLAVKEGVDWDSIEEKSLKSKFQNERPGYVGKFSGDVESKTIGTVKIGNQIFYRIWTEYYDTRGFW